MECDIGVGVGNTVFADFFRRFLDGIVVLCTHTIDISPNDLAVVRLGGVEFAKFVIECACTAGIASTR